MAPLAEHIERVARRIKRLLLVRRLSLAVAAFLTILMLLVMFDQWWRLGAPVRVIVGIAALAISVWWIVRVILPIWRTKIESVDLALRLEGHLPGARHHLASALDFQATDTTEGVAELAADLASAVEFDRMRRIVRPTSARRATALLGAVLAGAAILVVLEPGATWTGVQRWFMPLGDAAWPPRAVIASRMDQIVPAGVHGLGMPLVLRAENRTVGSPDGPVDASWRMSRDDPWTTVRLTYQGDGIHERVIETSGDRVEVRFHALDCMTPIEHVDLLELPSIARASLHVEPPDWADGIVEPLILESDSGMPGSPGSVLEGSTVRLEMHTSRPLGAVDLSEILTTSTVEIDTQVDGTRWTIQWVARENMRLSMHCIDEHGISALRPSILDVSVGRDALPEVAVVQPGRDEEILPVAILPITARGRDDFSMDQLLLEATRLGAPSAGWTRMADGPLLELEVAATLDVAALEVAPGDEIVIQAIASDARGRDRRAVLSTPRILRVVDRSTFLESIRAAMASLAGQAKRIDARQADLTREGRDGDWTATMRGGQVSVARDVDAVDRAIDQALARIDRNALGDAGMQALLNHASESAGIAADAARAASEAAPVDLKALHQEIHEELASLIDLLGRDEDLWVARAALGRMLERQEELLHEAADLGRRAPGVDRDSAPADIGREMDEIAHDQRSLASDLARRLEQMGKQLETAAEGTHTALESALESARAGDPVGSMDSAALDAAQGRMRSAAEGQQAAADALTSMIDRLDEQDPASEDRKLARLRRHVESLLAIVDALIERQRSLGDRVEHIADAQESDALGRGMIKLRRNTVAAADRARKGEQDLAQVAGLLSEAATAQGEAAGLLRTWPFDHGQVAQARGAALSRLESARALLGRMHDAATEDEIERLRRELRQTYLELAQRQSALLGEVAAIGDRPVDRRTRFDTRRAGRSQINLGQAARAVIDEHAIVSGSGIFTIVHGEIDVESSRASGILLKGAASTEVLDSQGTITGRLEMLAEALGDDSAGDAPFERGGGSDGGGASGDASGDEDEPALPSIAELRLLRSMQSVMLDDTRATASSTSSRPEGLEELGRRQRALSDIAETLFERVRQQQDPIKVDHTPPDRSPPAWGPRAVKDKQSLYEVESRALDPLPSLDALLGLEEHGINVTPPARPTPRDSVEALLFEMRTAASDLEVEHDAGLDVQRMQARALERLDAMIDRARRQQGSASPDPTGGDTSDSQEAAGQTQGQQATQATSPATGEQDGTGGDGTRSPIDPRRSGPIEDERRQWGGLPPRVREMLEQGRRDAYATLYEQLTGEYFRTLAEDPAP